MTWNTARSYDHAYIRNIEDSTGETVAQVLDLDDYANDIKRARLIAAAPDLLAALYLALPFVEDHEESEIYKPGAVADAIRKIRAAIDKAEGARS
jgi:hypothetical protein